MDKKTQSFKISIAPWEEYGAYVPNTTVTLSCDDEKFMLHYVTDETRLRMVETKHNGNIWCDSCVEFFANFDPAHSKNYINFEMNPNCAMYCSIGEGRHNRTLYSDEVINKFGRRVEIKENGWEAWLEIPVDFVKSAFPQYEHKSGQVILANFYKCGDETERPHCVCWNNIDWEEPDFHRPEFFAEVTL